MVRVELFQISIGIRGKILAQRFRFVTFDHTVAVLVVLGDERGEFFLFAQFRFDGGDFRIAQFSIIVRIKLFQLTSGVGGVILADGVHLFAVNNAIAVLVIFGNDVTAG